MTKSGWFATLIVSLFVVTAVTAVGIMALSDFIQFFIVLPDEFTFWSIRNKSLLMALDLLFFAVSLVALFKLWAGSLLQKLFLSVFVLGFVGAFITAFVAPPHLLFRAEQHGARYVSVGEALEILPPTEEVLVVEIDGDARAFPRTHIVQSHVAGDTVGGANVVMTYCGLSRLGVALDAGPDSDRVDLKVYTQLRNNLVLYDHKSGEAIQQLQFTLRDSQTPLPEIPSTAMTLKNFQRLYPGGLVYFNPAETFYDKIIRKGMLEVVYKNYDRNVEGFDFGSLEVFDERLGMKDKIHGLVRGGKQYAYTNDFLKRNGDVWVEQVGAGEFVTVKYFGEYDFVDMFEGNVPGVDVKGSLNGKRVPRVPHRNSLLWGPWQHYYRNSILRK